MSLSCVTFSVGWNSCAHFEFMKDIMSVHSTFWFEVESGNTIGCYKKEVTPGTFHAALETCNNTGGYLVGIETELENHAIACE